ncbi:hypothetical protein JJL56_32270 [Azospirillum sp. YIM DDC1]|uniref:Helix-turn-helix domain-containing protein n=1 Tax=Azospirillum aestuarii TaxID=2802052 RepID=A0ABS1I8Y7_9PROT|nr:hypothetical protein [Azospirillum aestuarii]
MIVLEDRRELAHLIHKAHRAGARLHAAYEVAGITVRTLQRWEAERPRPAHALSDEERARILKVANEPRFAAVAPARIVPMLASEASFCRVLRENGQSRHRGRAKAPRPGARPPPSSPAPRERCGAGT